MKSGNPAQYVAFMRAINVGGRSLVKMSDLRDAFSAAGCGAVRTYIASGNVAFECDEGHEAMFERVRDRLRGLLGAEPGVFFRTVRQLERLAAADAFDGHKPGPEVKLYVAFLDRKPRSVPKFPLRSSKEALEAIALRHLEVYVVSRRKKNGFFGFPNNFVEETLGVSATTRNWSTVTKMVEFVRNGPR
jgi:uncharacterized protein (DUF1697 family)